MPFTLDQLDFLGVHVGVAIPPEFIENKRRAQEFQKRAAEIGARSDEMKQRGDGAKLEELFHQASSSAAGKDFAAALKLLEQVEVGLAAPDAPHPPPTVVEPSPAAEAFRQQWATARQSWQAASDTVDAQIANLQSALKNSGDGDLEEIAEFGLNGVTGNFKVPLLAAIRGIDSASGDALKKASATARAIIDGFRKHIDSNEKVEVCDDNPLGVKVSIRETIGGGLDKLEEALAAA